MSPTLIKQTTTSVDGINAAAYQIGHLVVVTFSGALTSAWNSNVWKTFLTGLPVPKYGSVWVPSSVIVSGEKYDINIDGNGKFQMITRANLAIGKDIYNTFSYVAS